MVLSSIFQDAPVIFVCAVEFKTFFYEMIIDIKI